MFRNVLVVAMVLWNVAAPTSMAKDNVLPTPDTQPAPKPEPAVQAAYGIDPKTEARVDHVRLGQTIRMEVKNYAALEKMQRDGCKGETSCQEKQLHLFLNRMEIKGLRPTVDSGKQDIEFRLLRRDSIPEYLDDKQQKAVWAALFGFLDNPHRTVKVNVSVGLEGGKAIQSNATVTLVRLEADYSLLLYGALLVGMLVLYGKGVSKDLFSDRGVTADGALALSLARLQMGFWFFLVVAAFLFIWLVIGELPVIPVSVLSLIGIAGGTTLGAAMIDNSKRAQASAKVQSEQEKVKTAGDLKTTIEAKIREREQIKTSLEEMDARQQDNVALVELKKKSFADISTAIEGLEGELRSLEAKLPTLREVSAAAKSQQFAVSKQSLTFIEELFSDGNGWSLHRVQMGVWTLVLGFVFVSKVLENLAMPEFDATLLALMGISSGTYLGFKIPELQPTASAKTT